MKRQFRLLLTGMLVIIPFAVTVYVIYWAASGLGTIGFDLAGLIWPDWAAEAQDALKDTKNPWPSRWLGALGAVIVIAVIYLVGVLTHFWVFRKALEAMEALVQRVPGVKTIYESVRDLLKLFGGDSKHMGKVVLYYPNGGEMGLLGILTNEHPAGLECMGEHEMVALYLPLAYMVGGPIVYVPRKNLRELDMPVEQALKLCATAEITHTAPAKVIAKASDATVG